MKLTDLPTLRDFSCPTCGAGGGIRCTYSGFRRGHTARQERLLRRVRKIAPSELLNSITYRDLYVWDRAVTVSLDDLAVSA